MPRPIILCPLGIERRAIAKRVRDRADVRLIGPGPAAIRSAMNALVSENPPLVILFGLAGGLRETDRSPRIGRVVDKDARAWLAPCVPPGEGAAVTIVGMNEPVLHKGTKKRMASAYAAALVDTESHVFAELAAAAGLRWGIIRGVSDGPDDELPAAVTEWVDEHGKTRFIRVILGTILNPGVIPGVWSLFRRAKPALRAAADRVVETLNLETLNPGSASPSATVVVSAKSTAGPDRANPIERQLGRKSARVNDPPRAQ